MLFGHRHGSLNPPLPVAVTTTVTYRSLSPAAFDIGLALARYGRRLGRTPRPPRTDCIVTQCAHGPTATRTQLLELGTAVSEIRHKTPIGAWDGGFAHGLDPARGDYASFASFSDPDGNSWVLQERGYRNA